MPRKFNFFDLLLITAIAFMFCISFGVLPSDICSKGKSGIDENCIVYDIALVAMWRFGKFVDRWGAAIVPLATVVVAWFTATLWRSTNELSKAAIEQGAATEKALSISNSIAQASAAQATAATESVVAARKQVAIAEATAQQQLRAYVHVHKRILSPVKAGEIASVVVKVKNTGATPALDVRSWLKIYLVDRPYEGDFPYENESQASRAILPPNGEGTISHNMDKALSTDDFTKLRMGAKIIYVNGKIEYTDVFGHLCWTTYRGWSDGSSVIAPDGEECAQFIWSHNGNACEQSKQSKSTFLDG